jgi:ERCC4-related helicase
MIRRFSSRRQVLGKTFLAERLRGAKSYDRIAGYFSSSILEVAGEEIDGMEGKLRIICNSELDPDDVRSARAAAQAMRREWCAGDPERRADKGQDRFAKLAGLLRSGKMEVRVLPDQRFGLIHGKAGIVTLADGSKTTFMGSANESKSAWKLNYELVWEDDSEDAVRWVREEFDALWNSHEAFPLAEAVIEDIERLSRRKVIPTLEDWKDKGTPASPIIETPVYRRQYGLWAHQKYFVQQAFEAHKGAHGARYVLADMVGLGKTIQLAMAALLMALWGKKPVLIIAPKPLLWQWQDEMLKLLGMPSAVWNGRQWVDENAIAYPAIGAKGIAKCPRRMAVVSQGLFSANTEAADYLKRFDYECVILDEAHRARRKNLAPSCEDEPAEFNNLLRHLHELARRTHSLLLATATPVQINPVEAWDLLDVLAEGREHVLGNTWSRWRRPGECLPIVTGRESMENLSEGDFWEWFRNPLPPKGDDRDFEILRRSLGADDSTVCYSGDYLDRLRAPDRSRMRGLQGNFGRDHNPFIRHIIRRTRDFLEKEIDPETKQPYLQPVLVKLLGEDDREAIQLSPYLRDAYAKAEEFCALVARRSPSAGFLKTLLLRRVGSTIEAGIKTATKMLEDWGQVAEDEDAGTESDDTADEAPSSDVKDIGPDERALLQAFVAALESNQAEDPKYSVVTRLLMDGTPAASGGAWLEMGCIIFSQYYDSVEWLARKLTSGPLANEPIGLYAGSGRSAIYYKGERQAEDRETLKSMVRRGELKLILGTDAASEGLNLQKLGTLINLDLPWNPTRLEQRKGRIQRIGQTRETVYVYNMRYQDSVEDRVHQMLSERLRNIHDLFGQIPDTLEDVWIEMAQGNEQKARQTIGQIPAKHPFEAKYNQIQSINWETCADVLNKHAVAACLEAPW